MHQNIWKNRARLSFTLLSLPYALALAACGAPAPSDSKETKNDVSENEGEAGGTEELTDCSGEHVDLQTAADHCGKCDNACDDMPCVAGACVVYPGEVVEIVDALPFELKGSTVGAPNVDYATSCAYGTTGERAFSFVAPCTGEFTIALETNYPAAFTASWPDGSLCFSDPFGPYSGTESESYNQGDKVILIIDGSDVLGQGAEGEFTIRVTPPADCPGSN